jgi:hypothetical protein
MTAAADYGGNVVVNAAKTSKGKNQEQAAARCGRDTMTGVSRLTYPIGRNFTSVSCESIDVV